VVIREERDNEADSNKDNMGNSSTETVCKKPKCWKCNIKCIFWIHKYRWQRREATMFTLLWKFLLQATCSQIN